MKLEFLYQDSDLFVVSKPSATHCVDRPTEIGSTTKETVAKALATLNPALREASEKPEDSGLIHRLDFETSGALLGAKNRATWNSLRILLKAGEIKKKYLVLLEGLFNETKSLDNWIGASGRRASKVRVFDTKPREKHRALPAQSTFIPITILRSGNATLCEVLCPVARRHQVRAHAAHLGNPLVGDILYGAKTELSHYGIAGIAKFILHASELSFVHPVTKKEIIVKAPLPIEQPS